jgi:hypothetical protein
VALLRRHGDLGPAPRRPAGQPAAACRPLCIATAVPTAALRTGSFRSS